MKEKTKDYEKGNKFKAVVVRTDKELQNAIEKEKPVIIVKAKDKKLFETVSKEKVTNKRLESEKDEAFSSALGNVITVAGVDLLFPLISAIPVVGAPFALGSLVIGIKHSVHGIKDFGQGIITAIKQSKVNYYAMKRDKLVVIYDVNKFNPDEDIIIVGKFGLNKHIRF